MTQLSDTWSEETEVTQTQDEESVATDRAGGGARNGEGPRRETPKRPSSQDEESESAIADEGQEQPRNLAPSRGKTARPCRRYTQAFISLFPGESRAGTIAHSWRSPSRRLWSPF